MRSSHRGDPTAAARAGCHNGATGAKGGGKGGGKTVGNGETEVTPRFVLLAGPGDSDPLLVTFADEASQSLDLTGQARLHVEFVERFRGFGTLALGWVAAPPGRVSTVSVRTESGEPIELGKHAALLHPPECYEVFNIPRCLRAKYGFALCVAEPELCEQAGLIAEIEVESGEVHRRLLRPSGSLARLEELIAHAPVSFGLGVIRHILADWHLRRPVSGKLPDQINALLSAVHQTISPDRNYGSDGDGAAVECRVDTVVRVGTSGLLLTGWILHDDSDRIREVTVVSLFGRRVVLDTPLTAVARADVVEAKAEQIASRNRDCGFIVFAPVPNLAGNDRAWFLELTTEARVIKRFPFICPGAPEPMHGIRTTVALATEKVQDLPDLFERAIAPSADWFWRRTRQDNPCPTEHAYGGSPQRAAVSVVVPLYGRIDLMRYQIACFSNDPEFAASAGLVELIYVLDDPAATDELLLLGRHLHELYGLSFRIIALKRNLGYSAANNLGAAAAGGSLLLFLNSDVLPMMPGWVGRLADTYRGLERCGILGCRLLFEDGSIQHAGMTFRASTLVSDCWENDHPGKGLPTTFDPHRGPAVVPAVTGACLMIDRALFRELGGMSEDYVIADFEDSDLCLQAQQQGWKVYYTPQTELYHLERQSMQLVAGGEAGWRQTLTLYNMWKHGRRWGPLIPEVLDRLRQ